jgi:hypothetical protein
MRFEIIWNDLKCISIVVFKSPKLCQFSHPTSSFGPNRTTLLSKGPETNLKIWAILSD